MALRFCDSFDHYTTDAETLAKYDAIGTTSGVSIVAGGRLGNRLRLTGGGSSFGSVSKYVLPGASTLVVGGAYMFDGVGQPFLGLFEGADATLHLDVMRDSFGRIAVRRAGSTVLGTGTTIVPVDTWVHIEVKAVIHDTLGQVVVRINDRTELNLTGIDTRNGGTGIIESVRWRCPVNNGDGNFYLDDAWIDDATQHGDVRVACLLPDGAGSSSSFTPSAGANWQNVDDATPDEDTTYNASSTAGHKDAYTLGALPSGGTVKAVQVVARLRKDDAGARTARPILVSGGVQGSGTTRSVSDSYTWHRDTFDTNPNGGGAWSQAAVNALEAGVELVS